MDKRVYVVVVFLVLAVGAIYFQSSPGQNGGLNGFDRSVILYKTKYCGCCEKYIQYLTENGYSVDVVNVDDLEGEFSVFGVPREMYSCHIAEIGGYFLVGHIPVEAIETLLRKRPEVDGIALPGMPPGSPGMPGEKQGQFVIFALSDGVASVFMRL